MTQTFVLLGKANLIKISALHIVELNHRVKRFIWFHM